MENHYHYLVVSRKRHRQFNQADAVLIKATAELRVHIQRVVNAQGEVELYCHSNLREKKAQSIQQRFTQRFEAFEANAKDWFRHQAIISEVSPR